METPVPSLDVTPDALLRANRIYVYGLGLTFLLAVAVLAADYSKPGSVSPEILWPFVSVLGVTTVSSHKYLPQI